MGFHPESQAHPLQRIIKYAVGFAVNSTRPIDSQSALSLLWLSSYTVTDCELPSRRHWTKSDYVQIPVY